MAKKTMDRKTYRELSEPFPSVEAANNAVEAFFDEVGELRKKHKIMDCYFILALPYITADGQDEVEAFVPMMWGSEAKAETLTTWAAGHESAKRQERLFAMLKSMQLQGGRREGVK